MAIAASAVFRVRIGGNALNGCAYDGTTYTGGTDYTQQDAPQASWSGLTCTGSASTTLTDGAAGGLFTSAMVGNAVRITGGTNFTSGFYFVVSVTDANNVVLDRTPAASASAASVGAGRLGGAAAKPFDVLSTVNAANNRVVAGNTVYIRGSGTDNPTSIDYVHGGQTYATCTPGDLNTGGRIRLISENGRAHISFCGLWIYNTAYYELHGFKFTVSTSDYSGHGVMNTAQGSLISDCLFDQAGFDAQLLGTNTGGCVVVNSEFMNSGAATVGTSNGLMLGGGSNTGAHVSNCLFHGLRGYGIYANGAGDQIINNAILNCGVDGLRLGSTNTAGILAACVIGNTIDGNGGNGIGVAATLLGQVAIYNNIISNHTGAGKAGIAAPNGTAALNARIAAFRDYNAFYNNTSSLSGTIPTSGPATAGHDIIGTDPGYGNRTNEDMSLGAALKAAGLGISKNRRSGKTTTTSYVEPGAFQRQEPTAALSLTRAEIYHVA